MHTIKGSAAMMMLNNLSSWPTVWRICFIFCVKPSRKTLIISALSDLILDGIDFIKSELEKLKSGGKADGEVADLNEKIHSCLTRLKEENAGVVEAVATAEAPAAAEKAEKQPVSSSKKAGELTGYEAVIYFEDGCEMENIRAFTVIHNLQDLAGEIFYEPADLLESDDSIEAIRQNGFKVVVYTDKSYEEMHQFFLNTLFLKELEFRRLESTDSSREAEKPDAAAGTAEKVEQQVQTASRDQDKNAAGSAATQSMISVHVAKLDKLMDLVGELVIAEAMVTQNPDLVGLELPGFQQAARQLHKITNEIQEVVMSVRMVPLTTTLKCSVSSGI